MATKFGPLKAAVKEIRIHLCQTSKASEGARNFVMNRYKELKGSNPTLPILVRECAGVEPVLWARFEKGVEKSVSVAGAGEEAVAKQLSELLRA